MSCRDDRRVIWEIELEQKLVNLVRERRQMWDVGHEEYLSIKKRRETLKEIALKLGSHITANSVKDRWRNIRNTYRHNSRRIASSKRSGNKRDVFEPSWHLWNSLQFLRGNEKCTSKLKNSKRNEVKVENEDSSNSEDFLIGSNRQINESNDIFDKVQDMKSNDKVVTQKSQCEKLLEEASLVLKILENDPRLDVNIDSKCAQFGKEIAKCLSSMPTRDAEGARKKIIDIMLLYPLCDTSKLKKI